MEQKVKYIDLETIHYEKGWKFQTDLHDYLIKNKLDARNSKINYTPDNHYLILCEHEPVFTIGKSGKLDHLLVSEELLKSKGISFYHSNRGGDITYHGPGQVTGYPIFDLDHFERDVHLYVRKLEEVIIMLLAHYNVIGIRIEGKTGVWIDGPIQQKICAIGVHLSRWVTLHGFALNVNTNLSHFDFIVPCGIRDENTAVCSMQSILKRELDLNEIKLLLKLYFSKVFNFEYIKN